MVADAKSPAAVVKSADRSPFSVFVNQNRRAFSSLLVLVVMMFIFYLANSKVFGNFATYRAIFISLPIALFVAVPAVFIITCGEIDLSFPSTIGVASWAFALSLQAGWSPFLGLILAVVVGILTGFVVGMLVTYFKLSS